MIKEEKEDFYRIKESIMKSLAPRILDFENKFLHHTFSSDLSYTTILSPKNDEGVEVPISFMSSNQLGTKLKCLNVEKKGFTVFKVVNHFQPIF